MAVAGEKPHYNVENLKRDFTPEELAANGAKGGKASGVAKRRQKTFRDSVNAILRCQVQDEEQRKALEALGIDPTMLNQIQLAVYGKAAKGDVEAARFLRDTRGEKPHEALEVGNLDGKPLASIDLTGLSDEELQRLAAQRAEEPDDEG